MKPDLAAAIDLGTNTALLLVARNGAGGALEVVADECRTPRLGAGVAARGTLEPAARERAFAVLAHYAARLEELGVARERTRAAGTAVLRRARDATEFVIEAAARTGLDVEILAPEEEARLGQVAVAGEGVGPEAVIVDVGGGSTEIACAALDLRLSVPIGAVVASETHRDFALLEQSAQEHARAFPAGLARGRPVVVLGGTGVNLACLALQLPRFDHLRAEGAHVEARAVRQFARALARMGEQERLALPIEAERAGILPAGLAVLAAALERIGAETVLVTGRGLRYGMVREILAQARA